VPPDSAPGGDWLNGVPLHRATELLAPEVWAEYRNKSIPMFFLEDPASVQAFEEGKLAESNAQDALLDLVRSGRIELRTLHPHDDPGAEWICFSSDIVGALRASDVDLENSTIRFLDGSTRSVRAFLPRQRATAIAPVQGHEGGVDVEPKKRVPLKLRVAEAFDRLPETERAIVNRRGGIRTLERTLQRALSDVPHSSIQRELRRLRSARSSSPKGD
jgi:hypothetical protein